ncbi:MAG: lytic transglycosylase domain-containing protein [Gammaproteobacteria bacterium]|nr:lytic transglycosylase domain-containing protein [Gammaproteobacteria bacterium]NBT43710.1 lytic transglycosylase domain-containing protein [Gammaproteobacteria bacterium]NBY23744.1 lytic transglycosylase domain-containing protein [Gammaproteobacteria bacterium]
MIVCHKQRDRFLSIDPRGLSFWRQSRYSTHRIVMSLLLLSGSTAPKAMPMNPTVSDSQGAPMEALMIRPLSLDALPRVQLEATIWGEIGALHGVDPYLLYAVALTESSREIEGLQSPWPWALHQGGRTYYPRSSREALAIIRQHRQEDHDLIDVGLMQVNLRWHGHRVKDLADLIDPKTNLNLGASILREAMDSSPNNLPLGIGRYHAWRDQKAAERYGHRVLALRNLLAAQSLNDE